MSTTPTTARLTETVTFVHEDDRTDALDAHRGTTVKIISEIGAFTVIRLGDYTAEVITDDSLEMI